MKRNLLLEYSENLAITIAKFCLEHKLDSNIAFQIKKILVQRFCKHNGGAVSSKSCRYALKESKGCLLRLALRLKIN